MMRGCKDTALKCSLGSCMREAAHLMCVGAHGDAKGTGQAEVGQLEVVVRLVN